MGRSSSWKKRSDNLNLPLQQQSIDGETKVGRGQKRNDEIEVKVSNEAPTQPVVANDVIQKNSEESSVANPEISDDYSDDYNNSKNDSEDRIKGEKENNEILTKNDNNKKANNKKVTTPDNKTLLSSLQLSDESRNLLISILEADKLLKNLAVSSPKPPLTKDEITSQQNSTSSGKIRTGKRNSGKLEKNNHKRHGGGRKKLRRLRNGRQTDRGMKAGGAKSRKILGKSGRAVQRTRKSDQTGSKDKNKRHNSPAVNLKKRTKLESTDKDAILPDSKLNVNDLTSGSSGKSGILIKTSPQKLPNFHKVVQHERVENDMDNFDATMGGKIGNEESDDEHERKPSDEKLIKFRIIDKDGEKINKKLNSEPNAKSYHVNDDPKHEHEDRLIKEKLPKSEKLVVSNNEEPNLIDEIAVVNSVPHNAEKPHEEYESSKANYKSANSIENLDNNGQIGDQKHPKTDDKSKERNRNDQNYRDSFLIKLLRKAKAKIKELKEKKLNKMKHENQKEAKKLDNKSKSRKSKKRLKLKQTEKSKITSHDKDHGIQNPDEIKIMSKVPAKSEPINKLKDRRDSAREQKHGTKLVHDFEKPTKLIKDHSKNEQLDPSGKIVSHHHKNFGHIDVYGHHKTSHYRKASKHHLKKSSDHDNKVNKTRIIRNDKENFEKEKELIQILLNQVKLIKSQQENAENADIETSTKSVEKGNFLQDSEPHQPEIKEDIKFSPKIESDGEKDLNILNLEENKKDAVSDHAYDSNDLQENDLTSKQTEQKEETSKSAKNKLPNTSKTSKLLSPSKGQLEEKETIKEKAQNSSKKDSKSTSKIILSKEKLRELLKSIIRIYLKKQNEKNDREEQERNREKILKLEPRSAQSSDRYTNGTIAAIKGNVAAPKSSTAISLKTHEPNSTVTYQDDESSIHEPKEEPKLNKNDDQMKFIKGDDSLNYDDDASSASVTTKSSISSTAEGHQSQVDLENPSGSGQVNKTEDEKLGNGDLEHGNGGNNDEKVTEETEEPFTLLVLEKLAQALRENAFGGKI